MCGISMDKMEDEMEYKKFSENRYDINSYLFFDKNTGFAAVIDPGINSKALITFMEENNLDLSMILLTHGHVDHILEIPVLLAKYDAKIYAHQEEKTLLADASKNLSAAMGPAKLELDADYYLADGDSVRLEDLELKVLHTPGHTKGGICFYSETDIFTGDTLFRGSIGRTDLYSGNYDEMLNSLVKLSKLDRNLKVFPGHGGSSTLQREVDTNPFYRGLI